MKAALGLGNAHSSMFLGRAIKLLLFPLPTTGLSLYSAERAAPA